MELGPGQTIDDRYVVESALGRGGMAVVYKVRHQQLGSYHALKVLSGSVTAVRERLLREGQVQAAMRHPNVVGVTDVVSVSGQPGLVMEYVDGPALDTLLAERRLTVDQADELVRGILSAVAAAHQAGLVHRDLKPANILLQVEKEALVPKVTDFGLAKLLEVAPEDQRIHTRTGAAMGTPPYMAPEQVRDSSTVDARADVFALGAIAYELLSGERAFRGNDSFEIFSAVTEGRYPPLSADLPERMVAAIEQALQVDREVRPADASAFLDAWLAGTEQPTSSWGDLLDDAERLGTAGSTGFTLGSGQTGSEPTYDPDLAPASGGSEATWADGAVAEEVSDSDTFAAEPGAFDASADPSEVELNGASAASDAPSREAPRLPVVVRTDSSGQLTFYGLAILGVVLGVAAVALFVVYGPAGPERATTDAPPVADQPAPEPEPEPITAPLQPGLHGTVEVEGEAIVHLIDERGTSQDVGRVKPGTYRIQLGADGEDVGELVLEPGQTRTLSCSEETCEVSP